MKVAILVLASIASLLAGCANFEATILPGRDLGNYRRFFVERGRSDDHNIASAIVRTLQERGFEADYGPLTMQPENAQAIVSFEDRWTWDFKSHLLALRMTVRDAETGQPLATASFYAGAEIKGEPSEVVAELIEKLFPRARK